jgi:hypothetical protein
LFEEPKGTTKLKRIVEAVFLAVASTVLIAQLVSVYLGWRHGKSVDREILRAAHAEIVRIIAQFPPAFLVTYRNSGRLPITKTHFRLIIELEAAEIARTDRDYGEIEPGKAEDVLLQTVPSVSPPPKVEPGAKLTYRLYVFPNNKKSLPELSGEITVH